MNDKYLILSGLFLSISELEYFLFYLFILILEMKALLAIE